MKLYLRSNPPNTGTGLEFFVTCAPETSSLDAQPVLLAWNPKQRNFSSISTLTGNFTFAGTLTITGGVFKLPVYSASQLPTATDNELIFVPDDAGGTVVAYSTGAVWKRIDTNAPISL